jgi:hypothetical protein
MDRSIGAAMQAYHEILERAGLLQFFEPIEQRVTLSNHAGKSKPNREVFQLALERLGMANTPFTQCALVTEDANHVRRVRKELGMQAFLFGSDFIDWVELPKLLGLAAVADVPRKWHIISVPGYSDLSKIEVEFTGSTDETEEVRSFIAGLAARNQIAGVAGAGELRTTHELIQGPNGYPRLVRRRFSRH